MTIDEEIQAVIDDPNTTDWLRKALQTSLDRRDPIQMLDDVDRFEDLMARYIHEKAAEAAAWHAVRRAGA